MRNDEPDAMPCEIDEAQGFTVGAPPLCTERVCRVFVPCVPWTKGNSKRIATAPNGRMFVASNPAEKRAQDVLASDVAVAARRGGWNGVPFTGPLRVDVTTVLKIPDVSKLWPESRRQRARVGLELPHAKANTGSVRRNGKVVKVGDRGNYLKFVEDALQGVLFKDDVQVVDGRAAKVWGTTAGYLIDVYR